MHLAVFTYQCLGNIYTFIHNVTFITDELRTVLCYGILIMNCVGVPQHVMFTCIIHFN